MTDFPENDKNKPKSNAERFISAAEKGCEAGITLASSSRILGCLVGAHIVAGLEFIDIIGSDKSKLKPVPHTPTPSHSNSGQHRPDSDKRLSSKGVSPAP